MGLDMYLNRMPRYADATVHDISAVELYLDWKREKEEGKSYAQCSFREYGRVDVPHKRYRDFYRKFYKVYFADWDTEKKYPRSGIMEQVGYWRKANQIHNWFVENVQDGVDDCDWHREVTKEDFEELLDACYEVLNDPDSAEDILPTQGGFFFGSTEYGDWYMSQIRETIEIIENVLKTTDFEKEMVYYRSSW